MGTVSLQSRTVAGRIGRWSDDRLLATRLCDLPLNLSRGFLNRCIRRVTDELSTRELRFRPHFWFAQEWFSPDGVPGVAIPFYLAHPRLMRLEGKMMQEVEGGTPTACIKILRHETGHALDHAFLLHRRRGWQRQFGNSSSPYPSYYQPKPYSRHFVLHLDHWYAQSHPDEDFAETFAVWLAPRSGWRRRYTGWPALRKLEYVDGLMQEIAGKRPINNSRTAVEPLRSVRKTLGEYYEEKRSRYASEYPVVYDADLQRLFHRNGHTGRRVSAATFLERSRGWLLSRVAQWTGGCEYTLDQVLKELKARCRELKLQAGGPPSQLRQDLAILLGVQTMRYVHSGRHRVGM